MTPWYYEKKLAEVLGLPPEDLRFLRSDLLEEGTDWKKNGREIVISQDALDRLVTFITPAGGQRPDLDFSGCIVPDEKKEGADDPGAAATPPAPELQELVVFKIFPNPRLLMAKLPGDPAAQPIRVQVPRNDNFRPGMKLKARLVRDGMYQLEGRCPRFPGRY